MKLFSQATVAIDGSKFKAVNSCDRNVTPAKIAARKKQIDESIERYMGDLEAADRNHPGEFVAKTEWLKDKMQTLREQMRRTDGLQQQLDERQEAQISLTDPDSRSMMSRAKGTGVVGYNVQVAVDTKHHLIVAHEVTNATSDRQQLTTMAQAASEAMSKPRLRAYADRGYFNGPQIKNCDDSGIVPFVPKPMTWNAKLNLQPEAMTLRRRTVEHVFATLKYWMGSTHFLTRRLANVGTEMRLQVLAYHLKRVINILGIARTMKAVNSMGA